MNTEAEPPDRASGVVVAFPKQAGAADPQARLARAMADLLRATHEQRAVVAAWRGALAELRHNLGGLADSVDRLQAALGEAAGQAAALRATARTPGGALH